MPMQWDLSNTRFWKESAKTKDEKTGEEMMDDPKYDYEFQSFMAMLLMNYKRASYGRMYLTVLELKPSMKKRFTKYLVREKVFRNRETEKPATEAEVAEIVDDFVGLTVTRVHARMSG